MPAVKDIVYPIVSVWFDGACEPKNPNGNMGIGAFVRCGKVTHEYSEAIMLGEKGWKETSNNVAEYLALKAGLEICINEELTKNVQVFGDSKLVIQQMKGEWGIKGGLYVPTALICKRLLEHFEQITFTWIPREENQLADDLSKKELLKNGVSYKSWKK
jgi:ribonuclease HI